VCAFKYIAGLTLDKCAGQTETECMCVCPYVHVYVCVCVLVLLDFCLIGLFSRDTSGSRWRFGLVVTRWSQSTMLLHVGPG